MKLNKLVSGLAVLALAAFPAFAQNRSSFAGVKNASDYAYGVFPNIAPLSVGIGNTATGAQTITLNFGVVTLPDGTSFSPLATTAPITVGTGSNAETVTPSAVSCATPSVYQTCSVTATFANTHGIGDRITSGTTGVAEAVNAAHVQGGLVAVDGKVAAAVGSRAAALTLIGTVKGWTNVTVLDWMGTTGALSYMPTGSANGGVYVTSTHVVY